VVDVGARGLQGRLYVVLVAGAGVGGQRAGQHAVAVTRPGCTGGVLGQHAGGVGTAQGAERGSSAAGTVLH
jgi:hypothetical protein